jgi:hypothetical protein
VLLQPVAVAGEGEHPVVVGRHEHRALGEGRAERHEVVRERPPVVHRRSGHQPEAGEVAGRLAEPAALVVEPHHRHPGAPERAGDGQAGDVGVHHQRRGWEAGRPSARTC